MDASQEMRTVYLEVEKILEDTLAKVNIIRNLIKCCVIYIFIENEMKIIKRDQNYIDKCSTLSLKRV